MTGLRFDTRQDLTDAMRAGRIGHMQALDLMRYFDAPAATHGTPGTASLAANIQTSAQHKPAIETLSKMVTSGQCDALDITKKLREGTSPEFLVEHGGMDMGEAVLAAMDAERSFIHQPAPKIETRKQAVDAIRKFEANKSDMGDQVVALDLRHKFGIWEVL